MGVGAGVACAGVGEGVGVREGDGVEVALEQAAIVADRTSRTTKCAEWHFISIPLGGCEGTRARECGTLAAAYARAPRGSP